MIWFDFKWFSLETKTIAAKDWVVLVVLNLGLSPPASFLEATSLISLSFLTKKQGYVLTIQDEKRFILKHVSGPQF